MNTFFSMTPNHLRLALAVLSLVALVLGGSAAGQALIAPESLNVFSRARSAHVR